MILSMFFQSLLSLRKLTLVPLEVAKAFASGVAASTGQEEFSEEINETIDSQKDILGNYAIPDEQGRVDQILDEMPQNALDKVSKRRR